MTAADVKALRTDKNAFTRFTTDALGLEWNKLQAGWVDRLVGATMPKAQYLRALADGGAHDLDNCALAHESCNLKNVPFCVLLEQSIHAKTKFSNVAWNGGEAEDCPIPVQRRFNALLRDLRGRALKDSGFVAQVLQNIHRQIGMPKPTKKEVKVFKGHFNRWKNELLQSRQRSEWLQTYQT